ncbi:MAG: GNAT family N-acetyltransferase [Saprospiraceae bacterium]
MNIKVNYNKISNISEEFAPFIFIANRWKKKKDERVLDLVLRERFPSIEILPADDQNPELLLRKMKKIIRSGDALDGVFACSISFTAPTIGDMMHQMQLNRFFKGVTELGLHVVLINIQEESVSETNLEKMSDFFLTHKKQKDTVIKIRFSPLILNSDLYLFEKWNHLRRFIQSRIFAMSSPVFIEFPGLFSRWLNLPSKKSILEKINNEENPHLIAGEIESLDKDEFLVLEQGNFEVYIANPGMIPHTLKEIGRLREITFRAVGEGTGRALDIDDFDLYYKQLIIWDKTDRCIVGGYRIGLGDEIFEQYGVHGFYISSLFKLGEGLYPILNQSLELGRSYIIEAYQKKPQPLFLLWKGIMTFLIKNPRYRYLFGPVSISRQYSDVSRNVIVTYLKKYYFDKEMAKNLVPRKPYKISNTKVDNEILVRTFGEELANLDKFIQMTEEGEARLPVLLRQYLRQNARFIGFNVDPRFSDCLDGFIIADVNDLPESTKEALQKERSTP